LECLSIILLLRLLSPAGTVDYLVAVRRCTTAWPCCAANFTATLLLLRLYLAGTVDYLVDCLALHDCLGLLRPLLADPAVLKVLHGGANDVLWLQRDAHLYLVNVFDTEKAALVRDH
jgi:hypothetical protein